MDFDKIKRLFAEYIEYFKEDGCKNRDFHQTPTLPFLAYTVPMVAHD